VHLSNHTSNCLQGLTATEDDWAATWSVNVASYSFMAQACYEEMKKISLTENCSIVNLSSTSAHQTQPDRFLKNGIIFAARMAFSVLF
jgi:NAD(P)-dependent dehydrogenase (short-subunit alcohol dehydrogenase family)